MLILRNLMSGLKDWWIDLEDYDGNLYDINWCGRPLIATERELHDFTTKLALEAERNGGYLTFFHHAKGIWKTIRLKSISTIPIKRAS